MEVIRNSDTSAVWPLVAEVRLWFCIALLWRQLRRTVVGRDVLLQRARVLEAQYGRLKSEESTRTEDSMALGEVQHAYQLLKEYLGHFSEQLLHASPVPEQVDVVDEALVEDRHNG